ncbi:hypothetical protein MMPV_003316 [Pyropia vietnamensis]
MAALSGTPLGIARPALYVVHWLWTLVIFAATADKLRGPYGNSCYFRGRESMCNFIIAWGVLAWLFTSAVIASFVLGVVSSWRLNQRVESAAWVASAVWWIIGAISISAASTAPPGSLFSRSAGRAVETFAWMLIFLSAASAGVAWVTAAAEDAAGEGTMGDLGPAPDDNLEAPGGAYIG